MAPLTNGNSIAPINSDFTPVRVQVVSLNASRYINGKRPIKWHERRPGIDHIKTTSGKEVAIWSDGQQSPPQPGWNILLTDLLSQSERAQFSVQCLIDPEILANQKSIYRWTLYGISS